MGLMPAQPLEFKDFSGGITENILQGNTTRYAAADNFFLTVDKKLEERPGFVPFGLNDAANTSNWRLLGNTDRIGSFIPVINETLLLGQSGRTLYVIDPYKLSGVAWTKILGPTGNEAIQNGDKYSQVTHAEFQRQVYLTSDTDVGTQPSKVFRNETNTWTAVTAGLPRMWVQPNFSQASLLSSCLSLANALRQAMIDHMSDNAGIGSGFNTANIHKIADKWSLGYLKAVSAWDVVLDLEYPGPQPAVTPALAATDQASLFTLVGALCSAYTHHAVDGVNMAPLYHFDTSFTGSGGGTTIPTKGPYSPLSNTANPTDLVTAAGQLDELFQKWYWHRFGIWIHSNTNSFDQMNRYPVEAQKIGPVHLSKTAPTVTPDFTDLFNFVNTIKYSYNKHVDMTGSTAQHTQADQSIESTFINLPNCDSLDSMYLLTYWLRIMYSTIHVADANWPKHMQITFTSTAGSANITAVTQVAGAAQTLPVGTWIYNAAGPFAAGSKVAQVTVSGLGTATLDRTVTGAATGVIGQASYSVYHVARDVNSQLYDTTTWQVGIAEVLTTQATAIGTGITSWLSLATELFYCLINHKLAKSHVQSDAWSNDVQGNLPYGPFFLPSISTVAYAFLWTHKYTVETGGLQYLVRGNPIFTTSLSVAKSYPVGTTITSQSGGLYKDAQTTVDRANVITGIPVLANDLSSNYDTVGTNTDDNGVVHKNVQVSIYRTTDGGNTYYELDSVDNGTVSYTDNIPDSLPIPGKTPLNTRQILYTSGNVVGEDQPPQCKFVHTMNGYTYYGAVTDTGQFFPNRIRQSNQFQPDAAPATFYDDLNDELTGISSTGSNLVAFCKNTIYRMSGAFSKTGQGLITHDGIADSLGCLNARSIVKTEVGLFFAGTDGFYFTDGYQVIKISLELNKTYAKMTQTDSQRRRIVGGYDRITRKVWWTVQLEPTDTDCSAAYVFYLDYGIKPSGVFTVVNGGVNFRPSSLAFLRGQLLVGHEKGYVFALDQSAKADYVIDDSKSPTLWTTQAIPYNYTSCAIDFGTTFQRKYATKVHLVGKNVGHQAIQINAIRDLNSTGKGVQALAPINYRGSAMWGDMQAIWGRATCAWKYDGKMDLWRRFPSLRSDFLQLQMVPQKLAVYSSSQDYPQEVTATVDSAAKTVTLTAIAPYSAPLWPLDSVGYSIAFGFDGYVTEYPVTAISGAVLTYSDPGNTTASLAAHWVIRGVKKNQRVNLTSFVIHFTFLGDKTEAYAGSKTTDGSGNAGENPS